MAGTTILIKMRRPLVIIPKQIRFENIFSQLFCQLIELNNVSLVALACVYYLGHGQDALLTVKHSRVDGGLLADERSVDGVPTSHVVPAARAVVENLPRDTLLAFTAVRLLAPAAVAVPTTLKHDIMYTGFATNCPYNIKTLHHVHWLLYKLSLHYITYTGFSTNCPYNIKTLHHVHWLPFKLSLQH